MGYPAHWTLAHRFQDVEEGGFDVGPVTVPHSCERRRHDCYPADTMEKAPRLYRLGKPALQIACMLGLPFGALMRQWTHRAARENFRRAHDFSAASPGTVTRRSAHPRAHHRIGRSILRRPHRRRVSCQATARKRRYAPRAPPGRCRARGLTVQHEGPELLRCPQTGASLLPGVSRNRTREALPQACEVHGWYASGRLGAFLAWGRGVRDNRGAPTATQGWAVRPWWRRVVPPRQA